MYYGCKAISCNINEPITRMSHSIPCILLLFLLFRGSPCSSGRMILVLSLLYLIVIPNTCHTQCAIISKQISRHSSTLLPMKHTAPARVVLAYDIHCQLGAQLYAPPPPSPLSLLCSYKPIVTVGYRHLSRSQLMGSEFPHHGAL